MRSLFSRTRRRKSFSDWALILRVPRDRQAHVEPLRNQRREDNAGRTQITDARRNQRDPFAGLDQREDARPSRQRCSRYSAKSLQQNKAQRCHRRAPASSGDRRGRNVLRPVLRSRLAFPRGDDRAAERQRRDRDRAARRAGCDRKAAPAAGRTRHRSCRWSSASICSGVRIS